jgi:hypothetical protein
MNPEELLTTTRFSRRTMLKAAGVGAAGFTVAESTFLRATAATDKRVQNALNITASIERFGVTALGAALQAEADGKYNKKFPADVIAVLKAARAQEHYHLDAWQKAGGKPLYKTFTLPSGFLTDYDTFFKALVAEETAETAAQIANMTLFTELKRPDLVKVSFQYAAEEAEHRLLANYALGTRPANDNAFAPAMFTTIDDFITYWKKQGIIDGKGTKITYPGPGTIDDSNVSQTKPGGVAVSCAVSGAATPVTAEPGTRSGTPEASPVASPEASPMA